MTQTYGVRSMAGSLRRVAVRPVAPSTTAETFTGAHWLDTPDLARLATQHDALLGTLRSAGVEVEVLPTHADLADSCFVYDPVFVTGRGAIVLQQVKPARTGEPPHLEGELAELGIPIIGRLTGDAVADGGDMFWLDDTTLAVGRGYRTNAAAHEQLRAILAEEGAEVVSFDLPHDQGPDACLHLMSVISPVDRDLAVVYEPLAPVALLQALAERGIEYVAVDPEEYVRLASNVLAIGPRHVVMFAGSPQTVAALEAHGVRVEVIEADQFVLGEGGPTCLTRPLWRE